MQAIINIIIKTLGVGWLLRKAYSAVRPSLVKWAQADGEDDWDDAIVEFLDVLVDAIAGKLEEERK